jgi:hypothetical protein
VNRGALAIIIGLLLLSIVAAGAEAPAPAPATVPATVPTPSITLKPAVEEGKKVLQAVVMLDGKPLPDIKVRFGIVRTFGIAWLGEDSSDADGIAAIPFPQELPGNERGELEATANITSPAAWAGRQQMQWIPGGLAVIPPTNPAFPRALWSARTPLPLLASILGAVGAVWLTYAFVITQILAIRKGGRS